MLEKEGIAAVRVFSRGVQAETGFPMTREAVRALHAVGIKAHAHKAQPLTAKDAEEADYILAMTGDHLAQVLRDHPKAKSKARLLAELDVADPWGGSPSDYEKCRIDIQNALLDFITIFKSEGSPKP